MTCYHSKVVHRIYIYFFKLVHASKKVENHWLWGKKHFAAIRTQSAAVDADILVKRQRHWKLTCDRCLRSGDGAISATSIESPFDRLADPALRTNKRALRWGGRLAMRARRSRRSRQDVAENRNRGFVVSCHASSRQTRVVTTQNNC